MHFSTEMEGFLESFAARIHEDQSETNGTQWILQFRPNEGDKWNVMQLQCVLRYFQDTTAQETLIVTPAAGNGYPVHIQGVGNIGNYLDYENITHVPHRFVKNIVRASEMLPNELPIYIQSMIVEEEPVGGSDTTLLPHTDKYFRIVREFKDDHPYVTFRARLIRESTDAFKNAKESNVTSSPFKVEFDMICKKRSDPKKTSKEHVTNILAHAIMYMQWIMETGIPITREEQTKVLESYDKLVATVVTKRGYQNNFKKRGAEEEGSASKNGNHHFLAPKPITMEQIHVVEPSHLTYGIHTIWKGYAVTDKADGERMLMYIDDNGNSYLINNTFDVFDTGLRAKSKQLANTLLDGEYVVVEKRKDGSSFDLFAAFDAYFLEGKSIMDLPLIRPSHSATSKDSKVVRARYDAMKLICDPNIWDTKNAQVELRYKQHIFAEDDGMKKACSDLLSDVHDLPYEIDGLIFTPADLSVFGYYPGIAVPIPENVRWDRVLKWKPAEQNTIDFLVTEGQILTNPTTKTQYREYKLYTGYNASQWEHISPLEGLRLRYDRSYAESRKDIRSYRARLFRPISHYEDGIDIAKVDTDNRGVCVCQDGSKLGNNMIVEFGYDNTNKNIPISRRWKPLRVREDKTRIFQRTEHLSKTANDLKVATSIWRSIHAPVTMGMLTGNDIVPLSAAPDTLEERLLGTDDVYYARDIPRQHMLSVHMLNFHNQGIKKMLYQRPVRKDALLELACGMAGDLPRWRDGAYRFIMGVDLVKDNITNPRDGAYVRMLKQRRAVEIVNAEGIETTIYPDMVFVVGDCAKPFQTGEAANGIDDESKKVLRALYHRDQNAPSFFKYLSGRAAKGFTAASCMFAIHYFFETEAKLDGFLYNVASNLRKDGVFIATFMDGDTVANMLDDASTGVVEGRKKVGAYENEVPVWAIIKRYTEYKDSNNNTESSIFGKVVEVFLENTNRLIPEYLVNLNTLITKAKQHGLEVEETQMFSHTFAQLRENVNPDPLNQTQLDKDILALEADHVQTKFSFLNRWIVFRKST